MSRISSEKERYPSEPEAIGESPIPQEIQSSPLTSNSARAFCANSAQTTIAAPCEQTGIGLHSGATARVRIVPETANAGRYFVRVDRPEIPIIPARIETVVQTQLSTELGAGDARVRTVEHLLAALVGCGIDNARIEIDGPELPLLDGSARHWAEAIAATGIAEISHSQRPQPQPLSEPVWIREEDAFVAAIPASEWRFSYGIDFSEPAIGNQWHSWSPQHDSFTSAIAPARTFALSRQLASLQQAGLIKGGSLENALVCGDREWANPPLRFANEPARHKLLDLLGDLSLLGTIPPAHYLAYKAGHRLHVRLASHLAAAACRRHERGMPVAPGVALHLKSENLL